MFRLLLLTLILAACMSSSSSTTTMMNELTPPSDSLYQKGEALLDSITSTLKIPNNEHFEIVWYLFNNNKDSIQNLAQQAVDCFEQSIKNYQKGSPEHIFCLEKLAISLHFQIDDYSCSKSLSPLYLQSIDYINQAIEEQLIFPISPRLAQLYEVAARLTIPHFYFSFIPPLASEAEEKAWNYLRKAIEVYSSLEDKTAALRLSRFLPKKMIADFFNLIELAKAVEGTNSLELAEDIRTLFHFLKGRKLTKEELEIITSYGILGEAIYQQQPSKNKQYFFFDLGYYYQKQLNDLPKALHYYLKTQYLEKQAKESLYYTAYFIAAIYIELDDYPQAESQYQKALTEKLSVTDKERAYFGLAMVAQLSGQESDAKSIWTKYIGDTKIMNGISGYYSYFSDNKKAAIKKAALELVKAVGATNAMRIVTDDWREE